ncbi:MAG: bacillithiol biosynthesis deacetylase BshB1 [Flavobacteriales bacterium]|nr:bacillithiol biosynthesis deacetylase BshB1 [Flavobacteriales bacterium]
MTNKVDILAIGVHPDDIELGCAGTILKHIDLGFTVGALDLTQGELGTRGSAALRLAEAETSAKLMGLKFRDNLGFEDGFVTADNKQYQMEIVKQIRKHQPDIVLCNAIDDRHPDHSRASELVSTACFLSGLIKIETALEGSSQTAWRPKQVLHYIQWKPVDPDFVIDISGHMDKKLQAVMAYSSQFFDPNSKEAETPISSKQFIDSVTYRAQDLGRLIGVTHAEGFTSDKLIGLDRLDHLL